MPDPEMGKSVKVFVGVANAYKAAYKAEHAPDWPSVIAAAFDPSVPFPPAILHLALSATIFRLYLLKLHPSLVKIYSSAPEYTSTHCAIDSCNAALLDACCQSLSTSKAEKKALESNGEVVDERVVNAR